MFFHKEVIRFAQRFIASKLLVVDGTFNTNKLRLPLLVRVDITNSGKTFPCASSYCPGETTESYDFFFQTLREEMWIDCYKPTMILGDQSAGLISAVDSLNSVPHSQLQFCNWHAVQAMKAKFIKSGYTTEELDGYIDGEVEIPGLIDHAWAYVQSETVEVLEANRTTLIKALKVKDQQYIS